MKSFLLLTSVMSLAVLGCKSRSFHNSESEIAAKESPKITCEKYFSNSPESLRTMRVLFNFVKATSCDEALPKLRSITELNLSNMQLVDVAPLTLLTKLETLNLWNNPVANLASLKELNLKRLSLNNTLLHGPESACALFSKFCSCVAHTVTNSLNKATFEMCGPGLKSVENADPLHRSISSAARFDVIRNVSLAEIVSAPGHEVLREPEKLIELSNAISKSSGGKDLFNDADKIILNVTTFTENKPSSSRVRVLAVEVIDGNHRFAAGLHSGFWKKLGDVPASFFEVRVNGWDDHSSFHPRWVPLFSLQGTAIPTHLVKVLTPDGRIIKGPTGEIPGDISSLDEVFVPAMRGVTMDQVLKASLTALKR